MKERIKGRIRDVTREKRPGESGVDGNWKSQGQDDPSSCVRSMACGSDDTGRMSGSIDLLLILPTVPPSLLCLTTLSLLSFCLSLGHLFTRLSMQPQPVGAVCPVGDFMRVGRGLPPVDRAPSRPPSPSAGDGRRRRGGIARLH